MNIGILHLTDLHISNKNIDIINKRIEPLVNSCQIQLSGIFKLYIVVSGDIANTGVQNEYALAVNFFSSLKENIKHRFKVINTIELIVVPGNHDCQLIQNNSVRTALLETSRTKDDIDESITDLCSEVQKDFWSFYANNIDALDFNRLSYKVESQCSLASSIIFHCYNTSWCSVLNEKPGSIILPTSAFLTEDHKGGNIVISIFHHPTGWFNPSTEQNNKTLFEQHILKESNIVLCGHEHTINGVRVSSLKKNTDFVYLEGGAFCDSDEHSKFNFMLIDIEQKSCSLWHYEYNCSENIFFGADEEETFILTDNKSDFSITKDFENELNAIKVPIRHSAKDLTMQDIFIYPDLDPIKEDSKDESLQKYIDAKELFGSSKYHKPIVIEGDTQSGKTSLLYQYFKQYIQLNNIPIYINGKSISSTNVKDILKRALKAEYGNKLKFDTYLGLDKKIKVLLIDNIDKGAINFPSIVELLNKFKPIFERIIVTTSEQQDISSLFDKKRLFDDYDYFRIVPLGYVKRNELIRKWYLIGQNENTVDINAVQQQIKLTFDTITTLLGEQLIPAYPLFVLTLLQSLDFKNPSFDLKSTSYAYCYQSLIMVSLMRNNVPGDDCKSIINFLTEFSYYLYSKNLNNINLRDYNSFYDGYKNAFIIKYSSEKLLEILINSNIIKQDGINLCYAYKYLHYYLIAKRVSNMLTGSPAEREAAKSIIVDLCTALHRERNANILIFISHHNTNSADLLDSILITSLFPFENTTPITLDTNDQLFAFLSGFVDKIKDDVLLCNTNPDEYREKSLKAADKRVQTKSARTSSNKEHNDTVNETEIQDISITFKIIKILGQIIKNQYGDLKRDKLESLVEHAYLVCFRYIGFFTKILEDDKEDLIKMISEKNSKVSDIGVIRDKVQTFLYFIGYRLCLSSFSNLSVSVGMSGLDDIYDVVAKKIDSPAAKLITFTIKSYYDKMNLAELESLMIEFDKNPVAQRILKARAISYVYNNNVAYARKQKIGHICKLRLING